MELKSLSILMLVQENQAQDRSFLYKCLKQYFELDFYFLTKEEQANLKNFFNNHIEISKYDRIILDLRFKKEIRQVLFLRTIPNLIVWEYDAWMNYTKDSKYFGKFSRYYELVKPKRIISSGFNVAKKLSHEGYDCRFIPKAYDDNLLKDMGHKRDIELGFIGRTKSSVYLKRRQFLEEISTKYGLSILRTNPGNEYSEALNRIKYFISCDYDMGEYMIKNFEAMACGCILFAFDQGEQENNIIGLKNMVNVVLYKDINDFEDKLEIIRSDNILAANIKRSGQRLAQSKRSFSITAKEAATIIIEPIKNKSQVKISNLWIKAKLLPYF